MKQNSSRYRIKKKWHITNKEIAQTPLPNLLKQISPKLLKTLEITHRIYTPPPQLQLFILGTYSRDNNSLRAQSLRVTIIDNKENKNNSPSHNSFLAIGFSIPAAPPMQFSLNIGQHENWKVLRIGGLWFSLRG